MNRFLLNLACLHSSLRENSALQYLERQDITHQDVGMFFNELPGDTPAAYGRNVARKLWTKDELIQGFLSPRPEVPFGSNRADFSPTRKAIFRGKSTYAKAFLHLCPHNSYKTSHRFCICVNAK